MHNFCLSLVDLILLAFCTIISSLCWTTSSSNIPSSNLPGIPLPHQYLNFGVLKPVGFTRLEKAFKPSPVPGPKPAYFDIQNFGYIYRHPDEPTRLAVQNRHAAVIDKPPRNPVHEQNYNIFNNDKRPHYPSNSEKHYYSNKPELDTNDMPVFKQRENSYNSDKPSQIDIRNYKGNIIQHSTDVETSANEVSTFHLYTTTDTTDFETTTPIDDLDLRIGVPDQLAASLLG